MLYGSTNWKFRPKNKISIGDNFIYGDKADFFCVELKMVLGKQVAGMINKVA